MSKRHERQTSPGSLWQRMQVLATVARIGVELLRWFSDGGPDRL